MSAVDVSSLVVAVSDVLGPILAIGTAYLILSQVVWAFQRVREALGFSSANGLASDGPDDFGSGGEPMTREEFFAQYGPTDNAEFNELYLSGEAKEGVDFETVTYRPATADELESFNALDTGGEDVPAQRAAMEDMAPGAQGSLLVSSSWPSVGTTGGDSYYSDGDDMDMDPSSLSDSQRRAMWG